MFTQKKEYQTSGFTSLGNPIREEIFTSDSKIVKCSICGEKFNQDEYGYSSDCLYPVCSDCFEKNKTVDNAIDFANDGEDKEKVNINAVVAEVFSEDEINAILCDYLRHFQEKYQFSAGRYIDRYRDEFAAFLEEKKGVV